MKIYTKTGDQGMTGLYGGARVSKDSFRITAYGEVDELNSVLGIVRAGTQQAAIQNALIEVQNTLFTLGAELAAPSANPGIEVITTAHVDWLERQIDAMSSTLSELKQFILPGGSKTSAYLHLARTICRRAERASVKLNTTPGEKVDHWVLVYLNRLSDFLFVLARVANQLEGIEDTPWVSNRKKNNR
jgi:cob(I)alamin adenosyltransferase